MASSLQQLAPILLIHGAWHGARHWRAVAERLETAGRIVRAIDLPAHGDRFRSVLPNPQRDMAAFVAAPSYAAGVTAQDAARAILDELRELARQEPADAPKPLVVAHSAGGAPLSFAAEMEPALFGRLVYLAAFMPVGVRSMLEYFTMPDFQTGYGADLLLGDPQGTGAFRINPDGDTVYLEHLRQAYYQDVPEEAFLTFARNLTPDQPASFVLDEFELSADRWGSVPRTYIRTAFDRALAPAVQDMMIAAADRLTPGNPTQVLEISTSHSPFAADPAGTTEIIGSLRVDRR